MTYPQEDLAGTQTTGLQIPTGDQLEKLVEQLRRLLQQNDRPRALEIFQQLHPADQADLLGDLALGPRRELVGGLDSADTAEILEHLEPEEAADVLEEMDAPDLSEILDATRPDVAADILKALPDEKSLEALEGMADSDEVLPLLNYPNDSAGGLMITSYPVIRDTLTSGNALDQLRLLGPDAERVGRVVVVDNLRKLVGTLALPGWRWPALPLSSGT